jgi:hypothetical protein
MEPVKILLWLFAAFFVLLILAFIGVAWQEIIRGALIASAFCTAVVVGLILGVIIGKIFKLIDKLCKPTTKLQEPGVAIHYE